MTEKWTKEERELYDARSDHEAWEHAHEIPEPLLEVVKLTASPELTRIMEKALAEVEGEISRTLDELESFEQRGEN